MLTDDTPSARIITCEDCGVDVECKRPSRRRICAGCRRSRSSAASTEISRKRRRENGVQPRDALRTRTITCDPCGAEVVWVGKNSGSHKKSCAACVRKRHNERVRVRKAAQRAAAGIVPLGAVISCTGCGKGFAKQAPNQKACPDCAPVIERGQVEAWRQKSRDTLNARERDRHKTDPAFALTKRMRRLMLHSLKTKKAGRSWEALVGYTVHDLMRHLERQFLPGMTWDNRDLWHVEHIVPVSSFQYETPEDPEFKAAWGLPNIRPLWGKDNLQKSAKRLYLL